MVDFPVDIDALCFLCKDNRNTKILCDDAGNPDPGSLDRENLRDFIAWKSSSEFLSNLIDQIDIHLMI